MGGGKEREGHQIPEVGRTGGNSRIISQGA